MSKSSVKIGLLVLAATALAACAREPKHTGSLPDYPSEYRDRHPIVLTTAEQSLDIYTAGPARDIDARQKAELRNLAQDYQKHGRGAMRLLVPRGSNGATNPGAHAVRNVLSAAGARNIEQSIYNVPGPAGDQPIRVVFAKFKAKVATKCGQWPDDLSMSSMKQNWENRPYYNFGCAYQNMIAQQTNDPLDLVRPNPESSIDTQRRITVMEAQRAGEDSSTNYRSTATTINSTVGQ